MSLDLEGSEGVALRGMRLVEFRPRFLLVEVRFPDEVLPYLREHGYEEVEQLTHHDILFRDASAH